MKSLTLGVMGWERKRRKAAGAAKRRGERDAYVQPRVGRPAPQGTGEQHENKRWVGRPLAASPRMLCSGRGQHGQLVGLGPWQPLLEPGKGADGCCRAQRLGELVMQGTESCGGNGRQEGPR